jgi:hypothetical protein
MPIYDRPTKQLMGDWAKQHLTPSQIFGKAAPIRWFAEHYPKINRNTVAMHVEGMSINNHVRQHHPNIKPGSGHYLFFKLGRDQYRLWDSANDSPPRYKPDFEKQPADDDYVEDDGGSDAEGEEQPDGDADRKFAFERDLQNYLVNNLGVIEPGLRLYEEEGLTGVEYVAGGRRIDILAVDKDGAFVVVELKVSRGYDRVVGQLLRYIGWVERNMAPTKPVRGVIVASEISEDLKLACSRLSGVRLIEYELSFKLRPV